MQNQFHSASSHNPQPILGQQALDQQTLGQSLHSLYKAIANFMVHRPQASAQSPVISSEQRYSAKARLYPYLPTSEEQRDWLDRLY